MEKLRLAGRCLLFPILSVVFTLGIFIVGVLVVIYCGGQLAYEGLFETDE